MPSIGFKTIYDFLTLKFDWITDNNKIYFAFAGLHTAPFSIKGTLNLLPDRVLLRVSRHTVYLKYYIWRSITLKVWMDW